MYKRDGGWAFCGCCGKQRTWAGEVDPGCDCPGERAMVVTGEFSMGTPTAADLLRAARRAEESGAMLVLDGQRAADAIRDLAASLVPTPTIEEARPMNRAQRRAQMRRGGR